MKIVQAPRAPGNFFVFVDLLKNNYIHHVVVYNIEMIVNFVCCFQGWGFVVRV